MQSDATLDSKLTNDFWSWFDENKDSIVTTMKSGDEEKIRQTLENVNSRMQAVTPGISSLFGVGQEPYEFVVTAGGNIDYFPNVKAFVANAPEIDGWTFIAFRPASAGKDFRIKMGGVSLSVEDIQFQAFEVEQGLGITLYPAGMTEKDRQLYSHATVTILDHFIGEHDAATKIQSLMVEPLSEADASGPVRPMTELKAFLDKL